MVLYKLVYYICVFWFALQYHVTIIRAFIKALNKKCHYCLHSLSNHCCLSLLIEWYIKEEKTCSLTSLNINQIIVKDPIIQSLKAISLSSCDYMHTRAYAWILVFSRSLCIVMILNIVLVNIKGTYPGAGMFRVTASGLKKPKPYSVEKWGCGHLWFGYLYWKYTYMYYNSLSGSKT